MRTKIGLMVVLAAVALTTLLVRQGTAAYKDLKLSYYCRSATVTCNDVTPEHPTCFGLWTSLNHDCKDPGGNPPDCTRCNGGPIVSSRICVAGLTDVYLHCAILEDPPIACGDLKSGKCIPNDPDPLKAILCECNTTDGEVVGDCNFFNCEDTVQ